MQKTTFVFCADLAPCRNRSRLFHKTGWWSKLTVSKRVATYKWKWSLSKSRLDLILSLALNILVLILVHTVWLIPSHSDVSSRSGLTSAVRVNPKRSSAITQLPDAPLSSSLHNWPQAVTQKDSTSSNNWLTCRVMIWRQLIWVALAVWSEVQCVSGQTGLLPDLSRSPGKKVWSQ